MSDPLKTQLVPVPAPPETLSSNQETDARLALTRGLAEYLEPLTYEAVGGRTVRFKAVYPEYAEPEEQASYPKAWVQLRGSGVYEPRSFNPTIDINERLAAPDGRYLVVMSDFVQDVGVEVWANNLADRAALCIALERAFCPSVDMFGFVLEFPHYFNARGTYALKELFVEDEEGDGVRRYRKATFVLSARVPVVVPVALPDAAPQVLVEAVGDTTDVIVTVSA